MMLPKSQRNFSSSRAPQDVGYNTENSAPFCRCELWILGI